MADAIFDPEGPDTTETREWISMVAKDASGLIRELRVDADELDDTDCDMMAVELFQLAMERVPDRTTKSFKKLMRLMEEHGDTASAMTLFLMLRR